MHIAASVDVLSDTQFVYVPVVMAQNTVNRINVTGAGCVNYSIRQRGKALISKA